MQLTAGYLTNVERICNLPDVKIVECNCLRLSTPSSDSTPHLIDTFGQAFCELMGWSRSEAETAVGNPMLLMYLRFGSIGSIVEDLEITAFVGLGDLFAEKFTVTTLKTCFGW